MANYEWSAMRKGRKSSKVAHWGARVGMGLEFLHQVVHSGVKYVDEASTNCLSPEVVNRRKLRLPCVGGKTRGLRDRSGTRKLTVISVDHSPQQQ
jgi:hypothetical protein